MKNKIKEKIEKWMQSQAAKVSLALLVISVILLIFALPIVKVSWSIELISYVNNVLIGTAVGLIGIIVTISFVQSALDKQSTKNEKIEEYRKILRYNKYLQILVNEYMIYFNQVVTPLDKRDTELDKGFIKDFKLEDMRGMFGYSILIRDGFNTPSIKKFYEAEENLSSYLLRWIEEIDFKYTLNIEAIINDFLTRSKELDSRDNILGALVTVSGGKKLSETITSELTEGKVDYIAKFNEGKLQSNIMTSVVLLYYFLNLQQECINRLNAEISNVENELKALCD